MTYQYSCWFGNKVKMREMARVITIRASIMDDGKLAESDVGERENKREKKADVSQDASTRGWMRAPEGCYWLRCCAARCSFTTARGSCTALNACQSGFLFAQSAGATIAFALTLSWHGCQTMTRVHTLQWGQSSLSYDTFDHTIIALFNVVSCLWICAITHYTEIDFHSWDNDTSH